MNINQALKNLELNEHEIAVYKASLEVGESSIVRVREKCGLPRTTVFHTLERLRDLGLIEIIETATRRIYAPYPPTKLLTIIGSEEALLKEKAQNIKAILPELNRLYNFSPFQPRVRFFKGEEIKTIFEEILETPVDTICFLGQTGLLSEIVGKKYFETWVPRKVKKGIWTRSLRTRENDDPFFDPTKDLRKVRYLPPEFKCPAYFFIYGDNVATFTSPKENFAIVITSRENATAQQNIFNELWKNSKDSKGIN